MNLAEYSFNLKNASYAKTNTQESFRPISSIIRKQTVLVYKQASEDIQPLKNVSTEHNV